jgi:hypothetical protein
MNPQDPETILDRETIAVASVFLANSYSHFRTAIRVMILVITYSSHAEQKLLVRRISRRDVEKIIAQPTELFEDTEHGCEVAVGTTRDKLVVAAYRRDDDNIKVITVYHTRKLDKLVSAKLQRGAWRRIP